MNLLEIMLSITVAALSIRAWMYNREVCRLTNSLSLSVRRMNEQDTWAAKCMEDAERLKNQLADLKNKQSGVLPDRAIAAEIELMQQLTTERELRAKVEAQLANEREERIKEFADTCRPLRRDLNAERAKVEKLRAALDNIWNMCPVCPDNCTNSSCQIIRQAIAEAEDK